MNKDKIIKELKIWIKNITYNINNEYNIYSQLKECADELCLNFEEIYKFKQYFNYENPITKNEIFEMLKEGVKQ